VGNRFGSVPVEIVCKGCQKHFTVPPSMAKRYTYCSMECKSEYGNVTLTCERCNTIFKVNKSKANGRKFCSNECAHPPLTKVCIGCNAEFRVYLSVADRKAYCSKECRRIHCQTEHKCERCGVNFKVPRSRSKLGQVRYCSKECHAPIIMKNCEECGLEFRVKPQNNRKFCSRICFHKSRDFDDPEKRFWARVNKNGPIMENMDTPCWIWEGTIVGGYGQLRVNKKQTVASRFAYMIEYGEIDEELVICHHCDNPPCVRVGHLFSGTNQDNIDDMMQKGRKVTPSRKLSPADVVEIRRWWDSARITKRGREGVIAKAREFGVNPKMIQHVGKRESWSGIPEM
jgi:hypothetical protein